MKIWAALPHGVQTIFPRTHVTARSDGRSSRSSPREAGFLGETKTRSRGPLSHMKNGWGAGFPTPHPFGFQERFQLSKCVTDDRGTPPCFLPLRNHAIVSPTNHRSVSPNAIRVSGYRMST